MANYGYGYGSYTSQPQQYSAGTYVSQNAGTFAYATQPASRVVQGFQSAGTAYGSTGYQTATAVPAAAASGGYGYFQRASTDGTAAYGTTQKSSGYASTQASKFEFFEEIIRFYIQVVYEV